MLLTQEEILPAFGRHVVVRCRQWHGHRRVLGRVHEVRVDDVSFSSPSSDAIIKEFYHGRIPTTRRLVHLIDRFIFMLMKRTNLVTRDE